MGRYSKKRNIKKFWDDPLPNLCFALAVIAFVAGVFGVFALIGKANALAFTVISFALGVMLVILGKSLKKSGKGREPKE